MTFLTEKVLEMPEAQLPSDTLAVVATCLRW